MAGKGFRPPTQLHRPMPGARDGTARRGDLHYVPAANWSSRVVLPLDQPSNTLVAITRAEDMFKLYNWHRGGEDFSTLEVIAQPFFAKPGASFRWDYALLCAPPLRNVAHASTELIIGVSPHPTWLAPETKELMLEFAATRELSGLKAHARLVAVSQPEKVLQESDFTLPGLSSRNAVKQPLAVKLQDHAAYQLWLTFTRDGQPFMPDAMAMKNSEIIIPLIVGRHPQAPAVFAKQTQAQGRLRHIEPQVRAARLAYACETFEAFAFPAAQRCFQGDTFQATDKGPLQLTACAGEYESLQLVLMPKDKGDTALAIAGSELTGPDGAKVSCESINDFLYVPTKTPSLYNALFPVGEYPEALLPVRQTVPFAQHSCIAKLPQVIGIEHIHESVHGAVWALRQASPKVQASRAIGVSFIIPGVLRPSLPVFRISSSTAACLRRARERFFFAVVSRVVASGSFMPPILKAKPAFAKSDSRET